MAPACKRCDCQGSSKRSQSNSRRHSRDNRTTHTTGTRAQKSYSQTNNRNHESETRTKHFGCGICREDHRLATCKRFVKMNLVEKRRTVKKLHYCENCLARNHLLTNCRSKSRCNVCQQKHHTTLHGHKRVLENPSGHLQKSAQNIDNVRTTTAACNILRTLVPTALIKVCLEEGTKYARALLNTASTDTQIAHDFVEELQMKTFTSDSVTYTKLTFKSTVSPYPKFEVNAVVTDNLPKRIYNEELPESILQKFPRIDLADPDFVSNSLIMVEIGVSIQPSILKPNHMTAEGGLLMAIDSALGWLILGSTTT